jgi:ABC-type nitrate/sulfonate/bicarbonate transport system substrate-binding protein
LVSAARESAKTEVRNVKRITVFVAVLLLWSIVSTTPATRASEKLTVIYSAISSLFLALWDAQEAHLFEKQGLDVKLVYIQSAPVVLQSMMSGEAPIAFAGGKPVVDSGLEGGETIFIGGVASVPAFYFMAVPAIKQISDLRGKPVGANRLGGASDFAIRLILKKNNLEPGRDVPVLQLAGGMPALAAALSKQSIYAATLSTPFNLTAEKYGAKVLLDMAKSGIHFPHSTIISMRGYVKSHRSTVKSFLTAYAGGLKRMVADRSFSYGVIRKYMRVEKPELLEATYRYSLDFIERVPYVTKPGIAELLRQSPNPKARFFKPEDFCDESIVRELEQQGLFR